MSCALDSDRPPERITRVRLARLSGFPAHPVCGIGELVGTRRESVMAALADLQRAGIIELTAR